METKFKFIEINPEIKKVKIYFSKLSFKDKIKIIIACISNTNTILTDIDIS